TGERYTFEAYEFTTYVISFCQGGGSNNIDTQLEICDEDGTTVFAFNDDHCGLGSEITWTCDNTGTYSFVIYEFNCQDDGANAGTLAYRTLTPPTEQDCLGAIPLCFDTYNTTNSYSGTGHYPNEIPDYPGANSDDNCPDNCLLDGEVNDVWYTFTVQTSGTVSFVISPNDPDDDYDWAVYDITNDNCSDIYSNAGSMQVSCNFCGTAGDTGPDGSSTESCQHGDPASCTPFNDVLNVTAGETYVINVSNFSSTQSGYSIDFGGTAQIVDNDVPELVDLVYQPACGASNITVQMSERIWCLGTEASAFSLTGPQGVYEIDDVWSEVCQAGLGSSYGDTYYDDVWTLELGDYLQHSGDYTLELVDDGVEDVCENSSDSSSITFHIDGVEATATVLNTLECYSDTDGSATVDNVTGGTPPYTYLWSSGETTETATGLHGGTQYVTVTDSTGMCSDVVEVDIPSPPPIHVDAGYDRIICEGESEYIGGVPTASNGNPPYSYEWSPSGMLDDPAIANPIATPTGDQNFDVIVQDSDGCYGVDTVLIEVSPPMDITFDITDALCYGDANGEATAVVTGGTHPLDYTWSHSGLDTTETVTGLEAGVTYTVSVQDSVGCVESADVEVGQPDSIQLNADVTDSDCGSANGEISISPSGGTSPYSIAWETGDNNNVISNLEPGYYDITITDDHGCVFTDSVLVAGVGVNTVTIQQIDEILCYGDSTASLQANMPDGYLPLTFYWSDSVTTGSVASGLGAGEYSVSITDAYGCEGEASYEVEQPPLLELDLNVTDVQCADGNDDGKAEAVVNGGTSPYYYQWSTGDTTSAIHGLAQGSYSVTITDDNGCQVEDDFSIQMPDAPVNVFITTENVTCPGGSDGSAYATADGGTQPYQFIWYQYGNVIGNGDSLPGLKAGNYRVEAVDDHDCTDALSFTLTQPAAFVIETSVQEVSCREYDDGVINISVSGGTAPYKFNWSSGDTVPELKDIESGDYELTITDNNECIHTTTVYVPENSRLCIEIPNAFTPNDDGVNDRWEIKYIEEYPEAHVMVFNRWGQKLYDNRINDQSWDGTFNGEKCPTGSYTYVVDLSNEIEPFTGTVTIVY
ncbi:MAG: gliding motility-associated C-terminal domain-containing protein, partial [Bacteroidota bacterium]